MAKKRHGNSKIDWLRVERLKSAGHSWEHIAYMSGYEGDHNKLRSQYHQRKYLIGVKEAKAAAQLPWPEVEKCPNSQSSWGPGFWHMNVKVSESKPIKVPRGDHELFSDRPSSAGWV